MSTSSQLEDYSITLNDTFDTTTYTTHAGDTITLTSPALTTIDISSIGASGMYTIANGGSSYITSLNSGYENITINGWTNEDWVNTFPAWSRVQDMCKQYPALEIALRNFQTIYQLVKDDYDHPAPKK